VLDGPDEDGSGPLSEKSPYEPEEFDPSSLGPDVPEAPSAPDGAADTEVAALFWKLVLLYKLSIIGGTLGVLLLVFDQGPDVGLELVVGGVVLFGYSLYATRRGKKRIEAGEFDGDDPPAGDPAEETADPASISDAQGGDA